MIPLFPVQKYRAIITDIPDTSRLMLHVRMIDDIYIYIYICINLPNYCQDRKNKSYCRNKVDDFLHY